MNWEAAQLNVETDKQKVEGKHQGELLNIRSRNHGGFCIIDFIFQKRKLQTKYINCDNDTPLRISFVTDAVPMANISWLTVVTLANYC